MQRRLLTLALTATVGSLLGSTPVVAQLVPPAPRAERVEITQGPVLELAKDNLVIIRWTTNNPGGTPGHFAVVYYGTDPNDLSQMAKSPMQLNRAHPETIFRVRVVGVKPQTTYYYKVSSTESNGRSDGVASAINQFTTPAPGERIVNFPQPK
jgi:phosphodiesterase/alkaline phosphatase D-like protein